MKKLTKKNPQSKQTTTGNLDYDPEFHSIYQKSYNIAQYTIEKFGLKFFNPEIAFRNFISLNLESRTYDALMSSYSIFLKGHKDALEDSYPDSDYGENFKIENPLVLDLNEIIKTLSLHKHIGNISMSYMKLSEIQKSITGYSNKYYLDFQLQILEKLKFISGTGEEYVIGPIGVQYTKKYNKRTLFDFLENFIPVYPLRKDVRLIKNPKSKFQR